MDTPRTNIDATYLSRQPDFDISQEASFQSPSKDANLVHQMRNGGRPSFKTPRGSRAPFADRANMPASMGGAEFTPLLKSATRRNAKRYSGGGKENSLTTPALLDRIDEDLTPMAAGESSIYGASRNASSYMNNTPLPTVDSDSTTTTPMVMRKRGDAKGLLQDGNQLSLREQENVIDRIEKENFGLKLKIHFLEEALRKAGPGFSEAALKENTELKVDQVTMQRDLQRYKKHLTSAEKELESYRQQILEVQEKAKRKYADENQRAELERLRQALQEKEDDLEDLRRRFAEHEGEGEEVEKLQDEIASLEADIRRKDTVIGEHEDEMEALKAKADDATEQLKDTQRRMLELEEKASSKEELEEAKETIDELEVNTRRLEEQLDATKDKYRDAVAEKNRAEADLAELQDEMANKSMVTKGLSRQVEEKVGRLQHELDKARKECQSVSEQSARHKAESERLLAEAKSLRQERDASGRMQQSLATKLEQAQSELKDVRYQEAMLQSRNDKLAGDSASLQRDVGRLEKSLSGVQEELRQERLHALDVERDVRAKYKDEIDSMRDEMATLQAESREKDRLYDIDSDKWETDRQTLKSELDRAEERAAGLQQTVDKLREVEGSLSTQETRLQEALGLETERHKKEEAMLRRQVQELQQTLETRRTMLEELGQELSGAREQLDQSRIISERQAAKVEALEDEVEVLQATLDDESEQSRRELDGLRQQLRDLQKTADSARATTTTSSQALQDQLAQARTDVQSVRECLAEVKAERDHLDDEIQQLRQRGNDVFRLDQERLELRTAKTKLDGEIRRLEDENKTLVEHRRMVEKKLEDELEKAAAEEARLRQEVLQLQTKLQQSSDSHDARRTIRGLERRIDEYELRLATASTIADGAATEGNSEVSILHRDLTAARQKEVEAAQREASLKDTIKTLRRQVAELERKAHHAEMDRLVASPSSHGDSAQKNELSELRNQLSAAHKMVHELKRSTREAERQSTAATRALQAQLDELQEQTKKQKERTERYKAERDHLQAAVRAHQEKVNNNTDVSLEERRDLHAMLRESQTTAERLDRQAREMAANELELRKKLDRARSERAVYRASAEQLQKDIRKLKAVGSQEKMQAGRSPSEIDADAMVRASEAAERRHEKELRGMVLQMEWLKANWDRQARMRDDAAFAKNYLMLELQIRDACNKTDLAIIDRIRGELNPRSRTALSMLSLNQSRTTVPPCRLKRLLTAVRFVVRLQMGARTWSRHDKVRQRLADCVEGMEREERIKKKREQWREGAMVQGLA